MAKLQALTVNRPMEPGRYGDGDGLYLQVGASGSKAWLFRYRVDSREREMGLGAFPAVSLKAAREKAAHCRELRAAGVDPIAARDAARDQAKAEAARAMTFEQCAEAFISSNEAAWKNAKHRQQWRNTLTTYAYPVFGTLPVQEIDTPLVLGVLLPLWSTKAETANRLRGRIEMVLNWAKASKLRSGENPAVWRGNLDHALPRRSKVRAVRNHPALPFEQIGDFLMELRTREATAAMTLEFLILTACRSGEVLGARWDEFQLDVVSPVWIIPAERMKAGREHRVPLTAPALAVLERAKLLRRDDGFVFPGEKGGKPLSNMALEMMIRRMNGEGKPPRWRDTHGEPITPHGFRSTFRDWAAERTSFPREVAEMALAHTIGDKVEAAYRRGDLFEKRRKLMDAWAKHCNASRPAGNVTSINRVAAA